MTASCFTSLLPRLSKRCTAHCPRTFSTTRKHLAFPHPVGTSCHFLYRSHGDQFWRFIASSCHREKRLELVTFCSLTWTVAPDPFYQGPSAVDLLRRGLKRRFSEGVISQSLLLQQARLAPRLSFTPRCSGARRSATDRTATRSKRRSRAKTKTYSILALPRRLSLPATLRGAAFFPVSVGICFCLAAAQVKDEMRSRHGHPCGDVLIQTD